MKVFAYGILMRYATERATLPGYRLAFSGHATVRRGTAADVVHGGLISPVDESVLDQFDAIEGVGSGYYRRVERVVRNADGETEIAWVYMMSDRYFEETPADGRLRAAMQEQYERLGIVGPVRN